MIDRRRFLLSLPLLAGAISAVAPRLRGSDPIIASRYRDAQWCRLPGVEVVVAWDGRDRWRLTRGRHVEYHRGDCASAERVACCLLNSVPPG